MKLIKTYVILTCLCMASNTIYADYGKKPMTFMDIVKMRNVGSYDVSSEGTWFVYPVLPHRHSIIQ